MRRRAGADGRRGFTSRGKEVVLKGLIGLMVCATLLGWAACGESALIDNGGGLIYSTGLDITWYDYANFNSWAGQKIWAENLSVTDIYGKSHSGWRLPKTVVDGPALWGYDGTTTEGWNIKTSEMGHLFYEELGNISYYDLNGNFLPSAKWGLVNKGPFKSFQTGLYWSGTECLGENCMANRAYVFRFDEGLQGSWGKEGSWQLAMAVHDGNVGRAVPEPAITLLLGLGLVGVVTGKRRLRA